MSLPYRWLTSLNRGHYRYEVPKDDPVAYARWEFEQGKYVWERFFQDKVEIADKEVLDLGCGPGGKTSYLATLGPHRVVGVDFMADLLTDAERAKNYLAPPGDRIRLEFVMSDAANLPFPDDYFDLVTCSDAMEHFSDPGGVVRETARVLKPGGLFALDFAQWGAYNGHHLGDFFKTWWVHMLWESKDLVKAVRELGDFEKQKFTASETLEKIDELVERRIDHFNNNLNHLTISEFERILGDNSELEVEWSKKTCAHPVLWPLINVPDLREIVVARNVYLIQKRGG